MWSALRDGPICPLVFCCWDLNLRVCRRDNLTGTDTAWAKGTAGKNRTSVLKDIVKFSMSTEVQHKSRTRRLTTYGVPGIGAGPSIESAFNKPQAKTGSELSKKTPTPTSTPHDAPGIQAGAGPTAAAETQGSSKTQGTLKAAGRKMMKAASSALKKMFGDGEQ
ncbi:hypothetical protein B0H14DRAFT_2572206 [Mycena olivaceomarginata]|nr:hypothetical protein B0H14DRAFT_2572206 [Mycena olivaceomarginata]